MSNILLVGKEPATLTDLGAELVNRMECNISHVASGKEALSLVADNKANVVIVAELLTDGPALPFIKILMKEYPLVNCAMVSPLSPKYFHEATEGLGLFMQLPLEPGAPEADKIKKILNSINTLMSE